MKRGRIHFTRAWCAAACMSGACVFGAATQQLSLRPWVTLDDGPQDSPKPTSPAESSFGLAGELFGVRKYLDDQHICVGGSVFLDTSKVLRGGLDTEAWPFGYLLDLHVAYDPEPTLGWKGATFFLDFQSHDQGENRDAAVGDIQGFDNADAPRYVQIAQLWYKQVVAEGVRIKLGKIDANADAACLPGAEANDAFSLIEHGLEFLHSAPAFTPTITLMPTFPDPAPGGELFAALGQTPFYAGAGLFYSNLHQTFLVIKDHPETAQLSSGGMFSIVELGARWADAPWGKDLAGHAGVGGWYHNGDMPRLDDGARIHGTGGAYGFVDQTLWKQTAKEGGERNVGIFALAGWADPRVNPMDQNVALGVEGKGLIAGRGDDTCGIMSSWAHLAQGGLAESHEIATEVFYKAQVLKFLSVKPDLQYINSPSGKLPDALVATVRVEVDF